VITQSGDVSPSPNPSTGSLLVTESMTQSAVLSQTSDTSTVRVTGLIL
jgi:hypothetical protein